MFANLPTRRFGVEIEFVGCTPAAACAAIVAAGVACNVENYNHDTRSTWKIVRDGSVNPSPGMAYEACGELVSPPLSGAAGIEEVRTVLRALVAAGGTVNRTCGLHVHLDAGDLSPAQIGTVLRRYAAFQAGIDAFMPASRRNSQWSQRITPDMIARVERCADRTSLRNAAGHFDRYRAINVASFARHGTVEFRQHSGSVNGGKVARWIAFALFFVAASIAPVPVPAATVAAPSVAGRGRRPNFAARRTVVDLLSQGASLATLAERSGYTEGTLQASILGALRGMGRLTHRDGVYRFTGDPGRAPGALAAWLGNGSAPVVVAPVSSEPDTLWRGIPSEIVTFYSERAMDLDPRG